LKAKIILTFDLEEFDLPLEYDCPITEELQFSISKEGLSKLTDLLKQHKIRSTFFVTGNFCEKYPDTIKSLSENHEIASHAYWHSRFDEEYLLRSKKILETTTGRKVKGFRMPLLQKIDYKKLTEADYKYDSSINPTYVPGRYNNFKLPRTPYKVGNSEIIEFPVSVSPAIRLPLSWFSFKSLPFFLFRFFCNSVIRHDHYIHLYFHPWEFADIAQFNIPGFIKKPYGEKYYEKFNELLVWLGKKGEFVTTSEFLDSYKF
jgi:hypothetical protein